MTVLLIVILWLGSLLHSDSCETYVASAYSLQGKTASGQRVRGGIIAADLRKLKLHSKVLIKGLGKFIVEDTGGKIKGKRIDIWMPSRKQAIKFGMRTVTVCKQ